MSNMIQDSAQESRQYTVFLPGKLNGSRALTFSNNFSPTSAITEMFVVFPTSECDLLSDIIPSFFFVFETIGSLPLPAYLLISLPLLSSADGASTLNIFQ